jgi:hypothetical protein
MDDTHGARIVQPPVLIPDGLYDIDTIVHNLGVSPATIRDWERAGLRFFKPNTRKKLAYGADVIEFIRGVGSQEE